VCGLPIGLYSLKSWRLVRVLNMFSRTLVWVVDELDVDALLADLERSKASRIRAWAVFEELRTILCAAGQELEKPARKSFVEEGKILGRGLRKALSQRDEALRELAGAARQVDRAAFGKEGDFGPAHQALLKALDRAGEFL
jgi:hypothetical protein